MSACGDGGASEGGGQPNFIAGTDGVSTAPKGERRPTAELAGETLQGRKLNVADFRGKVVVMNVWGSWCPPCRAEAPTFAKVAKDTESQGVAFVGIDTRDTSRTPALAFEKAYDIEYPSLYDPTGKLILDGFPKGTLNPQTIPSTVILDREGKMAARALRPPTEDSLLKMIDPLIAEN
ncbi:TlpA disulfide reductase family protein [Streptomyces sp. DSM 15324]|uniref:TlpA family protein disulfide reductase n=1 Tax=Streptomyces sp. DSM 15324 TaxID=1739111 RepID=UPI00099F00A8